MKLVKNCLFSVLIVTVLAVSAFAGELDMPGAKPPGATAQDETKYVVSGDPDATVATVETSDYLLFEALAALLSVY
jgi:hypothetical protein